MSELQHPSATPLARAALDYITKLGWTIVAVGHNKRPLGEWGPSGTNRYDYTNPERCLQLNAPGIGVIAGPSGIVIIDLDNDAAIRLWTDRYGIPTTRLARTPRGRHLYYQAPPGIHIPPGTEILPGVDVRGSESYAILPPSILEHGNYAWLNDNPIEPLPDDVLHLLNNAKKERKHHITSGASFIEGGRNDHLTSMAGSMRRAGFNHSSILAAILEENKIRCTPSLAIREVEAIADSVCRYEPGTTTSLDPLTQLRAKAATREPDEAPILYTTLHQYDIQELVNEPAPEVDWIWESYLAGGKLSILHGEGGLGKSYLTLKIAEAILHPTIHDLNGNPVDTGNVIILDGENSKDETHRRIQNTRIRPDHALHYYAAIDPLLGLQEHTIHLVNHLHTIHNPRLVIIDSLRALWGGDEREQAEAGRMLRDFSHHISTHHQTAYLLIHHDNKGGEYSGSTDINAAITGTRLHLERYPDKNDIYEQPRILSQPKSRVGKEAKPYAFELKISTQDAEDRADTSGIDLMPIAIGTMIRIAQYAEKAALKYAGTNIKASDVRAYVGLKGRDNDAEWRDVRIHMNSMRYTIDPPGKNGSYSGKDNIQFVAKPLIPQRQDDAE